MKESKLKVVLAIIGGIVVAAGAIVTVIHFWEDIKKKLPCCKCECCDEAEEAVEEAEEAAEEVAEEVIELVGVEEA